MQTVRNDVERMEFVSVRDLVPFQGELKELSEENYQKLKADILEYGFSEAFTVWINPGGEKCLLNGHQRLKTLFRMSEEGYGIPELPIQVVKARDGEEAHMKVLSLTSQFGQMTEQSIASYISNNKLDVKKVMLNFRFPELKMKEVELLLTSASSNSDGSGDGSDLYTKKITPPVYEPKGDKPNLAELFDLTKTKELLSKVEASTVPAEVKEFLRLAAQRHTVFNYAKIAEYYSHCDADIQTLIEDSALVIIDFNKAIQNGFVVLTQELAEAYLNEHSSSLQ